jgi:hypothetical protein
METIAEQWKKQGMEEKAKETAKRMLEDGCQLKQFQSIQDSLKKK